MSFNGYKGPYLGWLSALGYPCFLTIRITGRIRHSKAYKQIYTHTFCIRIRIRNCTNSDTAFGYAGHFNTIDTGLSFLIFDGSFTIKSKYRKFLCFSFESLKQTISFTYDFLYRCSGSIIMILDNIIIIILPVNPCFRNIEA